MGEGRHYLEVELYERMRTDSRIFDFLQAGSLDGLWYWDMEDPEQEWFSPRLKAVFGYEDHEIPNSSAWWQRNIFPDDLIATINNLQKHLQDPDHPYDQVARYRHKDGSTVWVRCRGLVIYNEDGKPYRMLGAHTDVTEYKRAESALKQAKEELEHSNQTLREFASVASHDLQAPLRDIEHLAAWIQEDAAEALPEESRRHLKTLVGRVQRMRGLLEGLLTYARAERVEGPEQECSLQEVMKEVLDLVVPPEGFTVDVSGFEGRVKGPMAPLGLVLRNLVENAIKHHDRQTGRIKVIGRELDDMVEITVVDDGPGIPSHHTERVFELFRTLRPRDEVEGGGLGLSIVKKTVERVGGHINLQQSDGRGCRFVVAWPRRWRATHESD